MKQGNFLNQGELVDLWPSPTGRAKSPWLGEVTDGVAESR